MHVGKLLFTLLLILFFLPYAFGQKSKSQLQKEKQANLKKIQQVEKILSETSTKKKNSLGELNALNHRIKQQEKLMESIKSEINMLDGEIHENQDIIIVLEEDLRDLKKEFAEMLYQAQKTYNSISPLTFIFSAKSLDEMLTRIRYIEQYTKARKLQAEEIQKVQKELVAQVDLIKARKADKTKLLDEQLTENNKLGKLKSRQNNVVQNLANQEKELRDDLEETRKAIAQLDRKIDAIIRAEMEREAKTTASIALSASFEDNKAKFPWPVQGFVSLPFGRQNHSALKGVVIDNDGVNIQTTENEKVKCIFDGEVRAVAVVPNLGNTVIINHGNYSTVYIGLKQVSVKKGQKVNTADEIGHVMTAGNGISELRFRIYKNTTALDPEKWLRNL